jgi:hypothetical protein
MRCVCWTVGTVGGWSALPDAVINQPLTGLDNPHELHSIMIIKYRGDRPQQERSSIYLKAVLRPVSMVCMRVRKVTVNPLVHQHRAACS